MLAVACCNNVQQRSRLVLAAAMWSKPHLLALDEPTNYLDNDTLAALTHALKSFKHGGVIVISHNVKFVNALVRTHTPPAAQPCQRQCSPLTVCAKWMLVLLF